MESATPGVKSTRRRLAQSLSASSTRKKPRQRRSDTPFRAVALDVARFPRTLQGAAPALAMQRIEQFGLRGGGATGRDRRVVRGAVRRGGRSRAQSHRQGRVRRDAHAEERGSRAISAGERRRLSALGLRRGAAADRAAREGRRRTGSGVHRIRPVGSSRERRRRRLVRSPTASTTSRAASRRLPPISAIAHGGRHRR